jgi:hypothetical protein
MPAQPRVRLGPDDAKIQLQPADVGYMNLTVSVIGDGLQVEVLSVG